MGKHIVIIKNSDDLAGEILGISNQIEDHVIDSKHAAL
jgi:hypothetical protein